MILPEKPDSNCIGKSKMCFVDQNETLNVNLKLEEV